MSGLRVLVVEDEFLILDYLCDVIGGAGHVVVGTAAEAAGALAGVEAHRPEVVVLDITLQGSLDGIDVAERIRTSAPAVRHVFISGSGDPGTLARAQATEPAAFLQKPFNPGALVRVLDDLQTPDQVEH